MVPAELGVHAAGLTAVVPDVALDRVVAFDETAAAFAVAREEGLRLTDARVAIQVVYNTLGAFSTSLGHLTWEINVATTVMAILAGDWKPSG